MTPILDAVARWESEHGRSWSWSDFAVIVHNRPLADFADIEAAVDWHLDTGAALFTQWWADRRAAHRARQIGLF